MRPFRKLPSFSRPLFVAVVAIGAIFAITFLARRVDSGRSAQLEIASLSLTVRDLEAAPFSADPAFNSGSDARSPDLHSIVLKRIATDKAEIAHALMQAEREGASRATVAAGEAALEGVENSVAHVYALAIGPGGLAKAGASAVAAAQADLVRHLSAVTAVLNRLGAADAANARDAGIESTVGTAVTILLLLSVFGIFYFRSERLGRENRALLGISREEATTDALTELGNRRSLTEDLMREIAHETPGDLELLVVIYDLDGFKQYNDTFGHPAGDALLIRLGRRLADAVVGHGTAYRMGGDEFCVLARSVPEAAEALLKDTAMALSDSGEGWQITCSHGAVWVPSEAATPKAALKCADVRMYANKAGRASTGRQVADALLQVLDEQHGGVNQHAENVAQLAAEVAGALGQSDAEIERIRLAASLHDIGKTAIPAAILEKRGPLTAEEWAFIQGHTLIGERIILAAPALAATAPLVRSSHERLDGKGYPNGVGGDEIPLGSRIIAACDAYDAMTSNRSYRAASTQDEAIQELERCAGTHFDPIVVRALCETVTSKSDAPGPVRTDDTKLDPAILDTI